MIINKNKIPKILVIGNINMDLVFEIDRLPVLGENLRAKKFKIFPGGKAANQAVAASRLGAQVTLLGAVGNDSFSKMALDNLKNERINLSHVKIVDQMSNGLAMVFVEQNGENRILSYGGANEHLFPNDIHKAHTLFSENDIVLVQLGIPIETIESVIDLSIEVGVPLILDPTPISSKLPRNLFKADLLIPNETEFNFICDQYSISLCEDYFETFKQLQQKGLKTLVVKFGKKGCLYFSNDQKEFIPAVLGLNSIDTTGAGDAFAGAIAVEWLRSGDILHALRYANLVGGVATTKLGAQSAFPTRDELLRTGRWN